MEHSRRLDMLPTATAYVLSAQTTPICCGAEDYAHILPGCPREHPQICQDSLVWQSPCGFKSKTSALVVVLSSTNCNEINRTETIQKQSIHIRSVCVKTD